MNRIKLDSYFSSTIGFYIDTEMSPPLLPPSLQLPPSQGDSYPSKGQNGSRSSMKGLWDPKMYLVFWSWCGHQKVALSRCCCDSSGQLLGQHLRQFKKWTVPCLCCTELPSELLSCICSGAWSLSGSCRAEVLWAGVFLGRHCLSLQVTPCFPVMFLTVLLPAGYSRGQSQGQANW